MNIEIGNVAQCLNDLNDSFTKENAAMSQILVKSNGLYTDFIKWIKENGAIFDNCIQYPIAYGPLGLIGCKAIKDIGNNTAMLFIPNSIIISSDYYKPSCQKKKTLTNGMKLTLILLKEYIKGKESFWFPYISLILSLSYSSFPVNWNDNQLNALNNKAMLIEIDNFNEEINENYKVIRTIILNDSKGNESDSPMIAKELFKTFYLFTVSRLFYFTNKTSYLIPLADLLNHNPSADVKYEIFDSVNYTMKYTADLDDEHINKNLSLYTQCSIFFEANNANYHNGEHNHNNGFNDNNKVIELLDIDIYSENRIELKQSDYFVISTNHNQCYQANSEVYNNYGKSGNEYLLINFGFCLIDNCYDFSKIQMRLPKGNKAYTDMITNVLNDYEEDNECYAYVVRIKKRKVNKKVIDYFRLNYVYEKGLLCYPFTNQSEVQVLNEVIEFYNESIKQDDKTIMQYIDDIQSIVCHDGDNGKDKEIETYISIFQMTQKLNLLYQKEYIQLLMKLCSGNLNEDKDKHYNGDKSISDNCYKKSVEYYDNALNEYSFDIADKKIAIKAIRNYLLKWSSLE